MAQKPTQAFTAKSSGISNVLFSPIIISVPSFLNQGDKSIQLLAIWDTGATNSVITMNGATQLNLKPTGQVQTHGVHGTQLVNKHIVDIQLPNRVKVNRVIVTESVGLGGKYDFLIGMDIIGIGDFAITQAEGKTCFSFKTPPSSQHIDFVAEYNYAQQKLQLASIQSNGSSPKKSSRNNR